MSIFASAQGEATLGHDLGPTRAAATNGGSTEGPGTARAGTSEAQVQAGQDAGQPPAAADQTEDAALGAAPMDVEQQEGAARHDAGTENQLECKSPQEAAAATGWDTTQSSSQQERMQWPAAAVEVTPRGAQTTGISQDQSPGQNTPQPSAAVSEGEERRADAAQRLSKGKENSERVRRLPQDRQQQQWRKRRKTGQPGDHSPSSPKVPPGVQIPAPAVEAPDAVLPDVPQPASNAAAATHSAMEDKAAPAHTREQPGLQQQSTSSLAPVQCAYDAVRENGAPSGTADDKGTSAVPAEARAECDGAGSADLNMQSTVPNSGHEGSQLGQPNPPVEQLGSGKANGALTAPDLGSLPQTTVMGNGLPAASAAPAKAVDSASRDLPASAQQEVAVPNTTDNGALPMEETPAVPLPTSEADVQVLTIMPESILHFTSLRNQNSMEFQWSALW